MLLPTRSLCCGTSHPRNSPPSLSLVAQSAYIFFGGVPYDLNEGDLIVVFSQFVRPPARPAAPSLAYTLDHRHAQGEIADIRLKRDKKTGKSKGFVRLRKLERVGEGGWAQSLTPHSGSTDTCSLSHSPPPPACARRVG